MSLTRNTMMNLAGALAPLSVSLLTVPVYLDTIGEERYGVLVLCWVLLGYFGLFDLGLGRATAQRIAAFRERSSSSLASTFWTACILNLSLGLAGAAIAWAAASLAFGIGFASPSELQDEIGGALPWLAAALPATILNSVLAGSLQGRERFLELNTIAVISAIVFQLAPLSAALIWEPDLGILLPAALLARLVTLFFSFGCCLQVVVPGERLQFSPTEARHLLRFGGWVTISWVIGPLMTALDRFLIGFLLGPKTVVTYSIPFDLAQRTTVLSSALSGALFPKFSRCASSERDRLAVEASQALIVILSPLIGIAIIIIGPFLSFWISPTFAAQSTQIAQILLVGFWLNSLASIPYALLQAQGRPDLVAKCHLAELLPYGLLLYAGLVEGGPTGAAFAFTLRSGVDLVLLAGLAGILSRLLRMVVLPAVVIALSLWIAGTLPIGQSGWWLAAGAMLLAFALLAILQAPSGLVRAVMSAKRLPRSPGSPEAQR